MREQDGASREGGAAEIVGGEEGGGVRGIGQRHVQKDALQDGEDADGENTNGEHAADPVNRRVGRPSYEKSISNECVNHDMSPRIGTTCNSME